MKGVRELVVPASHQDPLGSPWRVFQASPEGRDAEHAGGTASHIGLGTTRDPQNESEHLGRPSGMMEDGLDEAFNY